MLVAIERVRVEGVATAPILIYRRQKSSHFLFCFFDLTNLEKRGMQIFVPLGTSEKYNYSRVEESNGAEIYLARAAPFRREWTNASSAPTLKDGVKKISILGFVGKLYFQNNMPIMLSPNWI